MRKRSDRPGKSSAPRPQQGQPARRREERPSGGRSAEGPKDDDELIDEASKESFPASDPPAFTPAHAAPVPASPP